MSIDTRRRTHICLQIHADAHTYVYRYTSTRTHRYIHTPTHTWTEEQRESDDRTDSEHSQTAILPVDLALAHTSGASLMNVNSIIDANIDTLSTPLSKPPIWPQFGQNYRIIQAVLPKPPVWPQFGQNYPIIQAVLPKPPVWP